MKKTKLVTGEIQIDYRTDRRYPECPQCRQHGIVKHKWDGRRYIHIIRTSGIFESIDQACFVYETGLNPENLHRLFPIILLSGAKPIDISSKSMEYMHAHCKHYAQRHPEVRSRMISEQIKLYQMRGF